MKSEYKDYAREKWSFIPYSEYHNPPRPNVDWICGPCNMQNLKLATLCERCGQPRQEPDSDEDDESDDESRRRDLMNYFSVNKVEHTVHGANESAASEERSFSRTQPSRTLTTHQEPGASAELESNRRFSPSLRLRPVRAPRNRGKRGLRDVMAIQAALEDSDPASIVECMETNSNHSVQAAGCSGLGYMAIMGIRFCFQLRWRLMRSCNVPCRTPGERHRRRWGPVHNESPYFASEERDPSASSVQVSVQHRDQLWYHSLLVSILIS